MKTSREQLKAIVKECLLELLSEGIGPVAAPRSVQPPKAIAGISESRGVRRQPAFDPRLDTPVGSSNAARQPSGALKDAIKKSAMGNPLLETIFRDTAETTLAAQMENEIPTTAASQQQPGFQEQFNGNPEDVFGEATSSRWAHLAFTEPRLNKTS